MKVIKRITIFALFGMAMADDPIDLDPTTLDFGNVLMGNTSTLSFTITANLEQTVTITPPNYYTVDTSEIAMLEDQTQVVNVTFSTGRIATVASPRYVRTALAAYIHDDMSTVDEYSDTPTSVSQVTVTCTEVVV